MAAEEPHCRSSDVCGGAGCAIVQAFDPLRQLTNQQAADDRAHPPGNQRRQLGENRDQNDSLPRALGNVGELLHGALDQRSGSDHVAADNDHHHLHGEWDQRPKAFAALDG
jgi:hypothetical protein